MWMTWNSLCTDMRFLRLRRGRLVEEWQLEAVRTLDEAGDEEVASEHELARRSRRVRIPGHGGGQRIAIATRLPA